MGKRKTPYLRDKTKMNDQFNDIIQKGKSEKAKNTELQQMLSLFHRTEIEYEVKEALLEDLQTFEISDSALPDIKKVFYRLWARIEKKTSETKSKTRVLNTLLKLAAAVLIGLSIGIYVTSVKTENEPVYYAAHSPKGSVSEMLLPDGSVIFLNADSRIKYSVDGKKGIREVFLSGEAWFDVAKNEKKPFTVHTNSL